MTAPATGTRVRLTLTALWSAGLDLIIKIRAAQAERVQQEGGEVRWRLTDVIGAEDGLGVECLSGSGAIASAYSKAFREVRELPITRYLFSSV